ncbi:hypothetical protein BA190_09375 [Labrys sp. WJW]|uniref:GPW/gp25 family protein n=1 Tax=Labrys sp. WJW TaxID=1737983 RepID=UPI000837A87D|nr:hypothetical protein [Labrys sp. WJW]OCC05116.1 hypothetical protein BA190_09375 [Labrys sp. WJW]
MPLVGLNWTTGRRIEGWESTVQGMGIIFSTNFGERFLRRDFGSATPRLLGENMVPETFLRFFAAVGIALLQDPRVVLTRVTPVSVDRGGKAGLQIEVQWRPRAPLGDFTVYGNKRVLVSNIGTAAVTIIDTTPTQNG